MQSKFSAKQEAEKTFIDQLALLTPSDIQGAIHSKGRMKNRFTISYQSAHDNCLLKLMTTMIKNLKSLNYYKKMLHVLIEAMGILATIVKITIRITNNGNNAVHQQST